MDIPIQCKGRNLERPVLEAVHSALHRALIPFAGALRDAFVYGEELIKDGKSEKQLSARIRFHRGGSLILNISAKDWPDAMARLENKASHSVERELRRRWELVPA